MNQDNRPRLVTLSVSIYLVLTVGMILALLHMTKGYFGYSLDDSYIHLALAQRLAVGHYGINAGEAASPSSSLLWPFLLAPLSNKPIGLYVPLLLNLLAGLGSAWLIGTVVSEWVGANVDRWYQRLAVIALVLIGNLAGLTLLGMEHGLQIFLAICCATGICRVLNGRPMPAWCLVAAGVAPMVRYEDLGLTLAVSVTLYGLGRVRAAAGLLVLSVLPLVGFSVFLHSVGLPVLPLSVLVKGHAAEAHTRGVFVAVRTLVAGVYHALADTERWPLAVLFAILSAAAWKERDRVRRFAIGAAAGAVGLHLLIGRFNWLHRYEVYITVFASVIVLRLMQESPLPRMGWYCMGLIALTAPYARAVMEGVLSADDVYGYQYQSHRFVQEYYKGNIGVTDLGYVSYKIGLGRYVLDLEGLASPEAAQESNKSLAWFADIVRRHDVGLVILAPPAKLPEGWVEVGMTCPQRPPIGPEPCADYISTKPEETADLKKAFAAFAATVPPETEVKLPK